MTDVNLALLDRAIDWATRSANDELTPGEPAWDQNYWYGTPETTTRIECGTVCCIAGWVGLLAGGVPDTSSPAFYVQTPEGFVSEWDDFAAAQLNLTSLQEALLFSSRTTLKDLVRLRDMIAANEDLSDFQYAYEEDPDE